MRRLVWWAVVAIVIYVACKKHGTFPPSSDQVDQLLPEDLAIIEAAGVDTVTTFDDALFADGINISQWLALNDSTYKVTLDGGGQPASDQRELFIGEMMKAGFNLETRPLHSEGGQNGLAYVAGSRTVTSPQVGVNSLCTAALYGTDCSGMLIIMAHSAGLNLPNGNTVQLANPSYWNNAFATSDRYKSLVMVDTTANTMPSQLQVGDIIVQPNHHVGIVATSGKGLGALNSLGSDAYSCAHNTSASDGPVLSRDVQAWINSNFKSGHFRILRVVLRGNPGVTTLQPSNVMATSATLSGTVTNIGGSNILREGVVWSSIHPLPTTADTGLVNTSNDANIAVQATGLIKATQYWVRAWAQNSSGIAYGNVVHFTTPTVDNGMCPFTFSFGPPPSNQYPLDFYCFNCQPDNVLSCGPTGSCAVWGAYATCSGVIDSLVVAEAFYLTKGSTRTMSHSWYYRVCSTGLSDTVTVTQTFTCPN